MESDLENGSGISDTINKSNDTRKKKNDPSLEQCIILLEPSLKIFQSSCIQNDRARAKKSKKQRDVKTNGKATKNNQKDSTMEDDDEVPPQLLRLVRFFHFRWLPMKRALLRPPPPSPSSDEKSTKASSEDVEVSIHYRLRLAKACWKKGLVAAAEYESLKGAFDSSGGRKKRKHNDAMHDNDSDDELRKRYKTDKSEGADNNLMERVRLSLMRLPTDAIRPERSMTAWRHVKEMILECCHHWAKEGDLQHGGHLQEDETALEALTPAQVADWTMTSWTALLLSRGMDCSTPAAAAHHLVGNNSIASIEKHLATLLSDRSSFNNPTLALAQATASRIDELLSPKKMRQLNGIHLYSLGKLFASFHSREDAEMHIITSIFKCSLVGGMMGLEQLARLLSVYSCCISATMTSADFDDALVGNNITPSRTTMKDLEGRLHAKLDDDEIVERIALEKGDDACAKKHSNDKGEMSVKAKSFLEAVLYATAHLVKCCKDNDHS